MIATENDKQAQRKAIYAALFGELKLEILRLRNTYEPGKARFAGSELEIFQGATQALGHPPLVMMSSWSPPGALKDTHDAKNGGTLARVGSGYDYAGFARWWTDSLRAYQALGIQPAYISIQNEPDWKDTWETCLFSPQETSERASYPKALAAVQESFANLATAPKLIGPETLGAENPQSYLPPASAASIAAVAHHLYNGGKETDPDSFLPALHALRDDYPNRPKFQTEFGRGDGFQTAWLIHNCLTEENASAYLYWASTWPGPDALITLESPYTPQSWKTPQGFTKTDRFYALLHYARFLSPGYVRVKTTSMSPEVRLSAFLSPDGKKLVVVALNVSEKNTHVLDTALAGFTPKEVYLSNFKTKSWFVTAPTENISLPARTVVTAVFEK